DEMQRRFLVRNAERAQRVSRHPRNRDCVQQFTTARVRISLRTGETALPRVGEIAWRTIGDEDENSSVQPGQLDAAPDGLVIRMGDDNGNVARRNRLSAGIGDRLE